MKRVALITGGSRGIGAATVKLLAKKGYAVCVNYCDHQIKAEHIVQELKKAGSYAIAVHADLQKESDILTLFKTIDRELGQLTTLVNNAGIHGGSCTVENITLDHLQTVFATNVYGTFLACREAVQRMKHNGGGTIVNVSSEAARFGGHHMAHYAASKAAINTLTIGLAREVAKYNIRVNTVSPGLIDTKMHNTASSEHLEHLIKTLPLQRMGRAEEVAELIAWLISDKSSYITGAIIPISGGK